MSGSLDRDVARLEFFSDAVFAFVATLLVVSLEIPTEFRELLDRLAGFPGFAVSFLVLILFWARHRAFFRRFGHYDSVLLLANATVLFSLLFFVFPLKWITNLALSQLLHINLGAAGALQLQTVGDLRALMLLFTCGFTALFVSFGLLYASAWRHRAVLAPTAPGNARLTFELRQNSISASVGVVAIALSAAGVALQAGVPLFLLFVLVPIRMVHRRLSPTMEP